MKRAATSLQHRLADAARHAAMATRERKIVRLEILPEGIEVRVRSYGRDNRQLISWRVIEDAEINPLVERIDYLIATIDQVKPEEAR